MPKKFRRKSVNTNWQITIKEKDSVAREIFRFRQWSTWPEWAPNILTERY